MKRFQTYFFDLDGTLIDHFGAIYRAHSHTLKTLGLPEPTWEEVRSAVGGGLERAIGRLAGIDRVDEALAIYRPYWTATMLNDVQLLPGARVLLERLHAAGATLAVLTNKHGPSSRLVCDHLKITPLLRGVFGATDTPWLKPQPEFTRYALEQLGTGPIPRRNSLPPVPTGSSPTLSRSIASSPPSSGRRPCLPFRRLRKFDQAGTPVATLSRCAIPASTGADHSADVVLPLPHPAVHTRFPFPHEKNRIASRARRFHDRRFGPG